MSSYIERISSSMENKENIRNISIVSHVDHGKTTLSDHLLQAGGLISRKMAGSARALDYLDEEQRRGITIKTANISFIYEHNKSSYLVNLIDTPGHVDFSGMVSQALRLVDGVIIVVDAVEQIMAQTESVIKQSMKEGLKPILFINKVDRLINELKLPKEEIETRLNTIIQMVNELISQYVPTSFNNKWQVGFDEGTVIIGAALYGWGISKYTKDIPTFNRIIDAHLNDELNLLKTEFPIIQSVMSAIIENVPNPKDAQKQRIELITEFIDQISINAIRDCSDNGPSILCVGKLLYEDNRGIISVMRIFSGIVKSGSFLRNRRTGEVSRIQQVCIYKGQSLIKVEDVRAGNIAVLIGLKDIHIGDTFIDNVDDYPNILFGQIPYLQESVISRRIEPHKVSDIPKLQILLDILSLIKPNFYYTTDENTGEMKINGIGELQLEIIVGEIEETGIKVEVLDPEVNLTEQIEEKTKLVKTDQLNLLRISVTCKPTDKKTEGCVYSDYRDNCLQIPSSKNEEELNEFIRVGFTNAILRGPLKSLPIRKITLIIEDIEELSANSLRYEIVVPLVRNIVHEAMLNSNIGIFEPIYTFSIKTPIHYLGPILAVMQKFGCEIENTEHLVSRSIITGEISVESSLQIASELRSASEGYAFWQFEFQGYKRKKNQ